MIRDSGAIAFAVNGALNVKNGQTSDLPIGPLYATVYSALDDRGKVDLVSSLNLMMVETARREGEKSDGEPANASEPVMRDDGSIQSAIQGDKEALAAFDALRAETINWAATITSILPPAARNEIKEDGGLGNRLANRMQMALDDADKAAKAAKSR